jgi:hypothetical protein
VQLVAAGAHDRAARDPAQADREQRGYARQPLHHRRPCHRAAVQRGLPVYLHVGGDRRRDAVARTNHVHRARKTALYFGTQFGKQPKAYLYVCWLVLAPRSAAEIATVAEEVRDLNS